MQRDKMKLTKVIKRSRSKKFDKKVLESILKDKRVLTVLCPKLNCSDNLLQKIQINEDKENLSVCKTTNRVEELNFKRKSLQKPTTDENKKTTSECETVKNVEKLNLKSKSPQKIKTIDKKETTSECGTVEKVKKLNLKRKSLHNTENKESTSESKVAKKFNLRSLKTHVTRSLTKENDTTKNSTTLENINQSVNPTAKSSEIPDKLKNNNVPVVVLTRLEEEVEDKNPSKEIETDVSIKQVENKLLATEIDKQVDLHILQLPTSLDESKNSHSSCNSCDHSYPKAPEESSVSQKQKSTQLDEDKSILKPTSKKSDDDSGNEDTSTIFSNFEEFDPYEISENDIVTKHSFETSTASSENFNEMNVLNFPAFNTTIYLPNILQNSYTINKIDVFVDKKIDVRARYSSKKVSTSIGKIRRKLKLNSRLKLARRKVNDGHCYKLPSNCFRRSFGNTLTNNTFVRRSKKISKTINNADDQKLPLDEAMPELVQKTENNSNSLDEIESQEHTLEKQSSIIPNNQTDYEKSDFSANSKLDEAMPELKQITENNSNDLDEIESQETLEERSSSSLNDQTDNEKSNVSDDPSLDEAMPELVLESENNSNDLAKIESRGLNLEDQQPSILNNQIADNEKSKFFTNESSSLLFQDLEGVAVAEGEKDLTEEVSSESQSTLDLATNNEKFFVDSCPTSPMHDFRDQENIPIVASECQKLTSEEQNSTTLNHESFQDLEGIPIIKSECQKFSSEIEHSTTHLPTPLLQDQEDKPIAVSENSEVQISITPNHEPPPSSRSSLFQNPENIQIIESEYQKLTPADKNFITLNPEPIQYLEDIPIISSECIKDSTTLNQESTQPAPPSIFQDLEDIPIITCVKSTSENQHPIILNHESNDGKFNSPAQKTPDVEITRVTRGRNAGKSEQRLQKNKKTKPPEEPFPAEVAVAVQCSNCVQVSELISQLKVGPDEDIKCHYCVFTCKAISKLEYHIMTDHFRCKDEKGCNFSGFKHLKVVRKTFADVSESRTYVVLSLMCRCCCEIYTTVEKLNAHVKQKHRTLLRDSTPISTASILGLSSRTQVECPPNCLCRSYDPETAKHTERNAVISKCPNGLRFLETMVNAAYLVYSCLTCSTTFLQKTQAVEHAVKAHKIAHRLPCEKCLVNFKTRKNLENHKCVEKTLLDYDKILQVAILPSDSSFRRHGVAKATGDDKPKHHLQRWCIKCPDRLFSSRSSLQNHIIYSHLLSDEVDEDTWDRMSEMVRMWKIRRLKMHDKTDEFVEFLRDMGGTTCQSWIKNIMLKEKSENRDKEQATDHASTFVNENSRDSAIDSGDDDSSGDYQPPTSFERFECEKPIKSYKKTVGKYKKKYYECDFCDKSYTSSNWLDRHKKLFCKGNPAFVKKGEKNKNIRIKEVVVVKNSNDDGDDDDQSNSAVDPMLSNNVENNDVQESVIEEEFCLNEFLVFEKKLPDSNSNLTEQEINDRSAIFESKIDKLIEEGNFENDLITGLDNDLLSLLNENLNMEFLNLNDYN